MIDALECTQVDDVDYVNERQDVVEDVGTMRAGDVDCVGVLDVDLQRYRDEDMRDGIDVEGEKDVDQTNVVVECKKVLDQKELDVIEVKEAVGLYDVDVHLQNSCGSRSLSGSR